MKITDIKIRKLTSDDRMKAVVSVTFDDELVVHDIKVIQSADKLFVAMPSRKIGEGKYADISHPITAEFRQVLEDSVLLSYHEALEKSENESD